MRMKALKTFKVGDSNRVVTEGEEFETTISSYERRGMAVPVGGVSKRSFETRDNPASNDGPFVSVGGETGGMTSRSLLQADQARPKRQYRRRAKPE